MEEFINRQAAINIVSLQDVNAHTIEALKCVPKADVRNNVRGTWTELNKRLMQCNRCGMVQNKESNYCPNCGAEMRRD